MTQPSTRPTQPHRRHHPPNLAGEIGSSFTNPDTDFNRKYLCGLHYRGLCDRGEATSIDGGGLFSAGYQDTYEGIDFSLEVMDELAF